MFHGVRPSILVVGCRTRLHSPQSLLPSQGLDHGLLHVKIWLSTFGGNDTSILLSSYSFCFIVSHATVVSELDCFLEEQYAGKTSCFQ
ncbi:hypothetical protein Peur_059502 [Populus x canadensis]